MRYAIFETDGEPVLLREDEISGDDTLALAVNCKATATFYIFPSFESWQKCRRTLTYVRIIDTDLAENRIIFKGRVLIVTDNMDSSGRMWQEITCFSAAEFLEDTAHTGAITAQSLDDYMLAELTAHNNAVDLPRRLTYTVTGNARVNSEGADLIGTRYGTLADILTGGKYLYKIEQSGGLINVISGYKMEWRERYANDVAYIDIAESFGAEKDTAIVLGENLKDIKIEQNSDGGIYTSVLAVGGVNSDGTRYTYRAENTALVARYGTGRVKIVEDTSIRCTAAMYTIAFDSQGVEYLSPTNACLAMQDAVRVLASEEAAKLSEPPMKITLNAVDLARLGYGDYEDFELGNYHPIVCKPLNLVGMPMRITGIKRKLASGQIASITIERGEKSVKKSGSLSWYMARLDELNRESVSDEVAQTEIAQTKSEEQTDGYVTKEITQEDYDNLPANSRFKTRGFCIIRNEQTGESTLMLNGTHISSEGGGGTIENAAILSSEEMSEWAPQHELVPLWFRGSATVYYGQAPARFVVQGNRVLWGSSTTPIENDLVSEMTFEAFDGTIKTWKAYIYSLSSSANYVSLNVGRAVYDELGIMQQETHWQYAARVPYTAQRIKIGLVATVSGWTLRNNVLYPTVSLAQTVFIDGVKDTYGSGSTSSIASPGLVPCSNAERDFGLALTTTTEPIAPT